MTAAQALEILELFRTKTVPFTSLDHHTRRYLRRILMTPQVSNQLTALQRTFLRDMRVSGY